MGLIKKALILCMWGVGNCGTMIGGFAQIVFKLVLMSVLR